MSVFKQKYKWNILFLLPCKQLSWNNVIFRIKAKNGILCACKCTEHVICFVVLMV